MKMKHTIVWMILLAMVSSMPLLAEQGDGSFGDDSSETFSSFAPGADVMNVTGGSGGGFSDRITLELKGVNILDVLKILAKRSGLNIVAGRNVRGDVTLYMQDVQVRRALDTIVNTLDLAYEEKDGIITVMSQKEFQSIFGKPFQDNRITETFKLQHAIPSVMNQLVQQMKSPAGRIAVDERTGTIIVTDLQGVVDEIRQAVQEFDQPLVTKVFDLQYAVAADIGEELMDYLTPEVGILKIDKRANRITITDRQAIVEQIGTVIEGFDTRPKQVLIDAKVVEVQLYDAFRFGIDWDWVDLRAGSVKNVTLNPVLPVSAPGTSLGSGDLSTFTIGSTERGDSLQAVMNVLENVGKTNILSSPRLLVLNNEEAQLAVATREPVVTQTVQLSQATSNTADQIDYIDVGVTLSVVPTISADGNVTLKIKPEVSTKNSTLELQGVASGSNTTFVRSRVPVVTTQMLETTVVVKDGTTVVVGGLIQDREAKTRKKIPVLGDIPILGSAFRTKTNDMNKTELVVFLTPHIVSGKKDTAEQDKYLDQNGDWIEFNKVGGYDFLKADTTTSQGPFRQNDKAYWESPVKEKPVFFPRKNTAFRAMPYRDKVNQLKEEAPIPAELTADQNETELNEKGAGGLVTKKQADAMEAPSKSEELTDVPDVVTSPHHIRRHYREEIQKAIGEALRLRDDLGNYPITIELFLIVERSGELTLKNIVGSQGLSAKGETVVLDVLNQLAPFTPFPAEMGSDRELLDLRFELK